MASVDALVMGRKTFESVRDMEALLRVGAVQWWACHRPAGVSLPQFGLNLDSREAGKE